MLSSYILRMSELGRETAFVEQGAYRSRSYTYSEIVGRAQSFAKHLREQRVEKMVLWAPPSAAWAIAFYGAMLAGVVVIPVDAGFSRDFVDRILAQTRASLLVTGSKEDLPAAPGFTASTPGRDDLAEIVYTSGTTAEPRGVMITHGNLLANLEPVEREIQKYSVYARPFRPLRFLHLIPLSHLFGQVMGLFIPQMLQGAVIFPESQSPAQWAEIIARRRISVMVSVPQQLEALSAWAEHFGVATRTPESLARRFWTYRKLHRALGWKMWAFVVGGAALPARVEGFWRERGYAVVQGYGLTETAPSITITHPFHMRAGSVGKKLAGVELRIAPDGEILVRGPNVSPGYYGSLSSGHRSDGWLQTGDLGQMDAEGNLIFLGRKKDMIVTADGLNVYPDDVEAKLVEQSAIQEAAVVARDVGGRSLVHAVLVPADGASAAQLEEAVAEANKGLEPHQRIRGHSLWPDAALPRTVSTQKVRRSAIADWVNKPGTATPDRAEGLQSTLQRILGRSDLRPETRLEDLGLSSLDRVELATRLDVSLELLSGTLDDLQASLNRPAAPVAAAEPDWPRHWPVAALRAATRTLLMFPLLSRHVKLRVTGLEKLAALRPPVLFVANHQSILDAPVILRALPSRWRRCLAPAMGPGNFSTARRLFLARCFLNGYLLTQEAAAVQGALRHAGKLADEGYCTLLFPEGERTADGRIHSFRPGVGVMAERLQLPVVPLMLEGLFEIWPVHQERPGRGTAVVRVFDPVWLQPGETAAEFTRRLETLYRN